MTYGMLSEGELVVSGYRVRVKGLEGGFRLYTRLPLNEDKILANVMIREGTDLTLVPVEPSTGNLQGVVECIYVKLETPIVVGNGAKVEIRITVPVDYAIAAIGSGGDASLIDAFSDTERPSKLILYGTPTGGYICRFHKVSLEDLSKPGLAEASLKINNYSGRVAIVSKVVIPLSLVNIYYKPGTWQANAGVIIMNLETEKVAEIIAEETPPTADFEKSPEIVKEKYLIPVQRLSYLTFKVEGFKMLWGY